MAYSYDKNTDYQSLINQDIANKDYYSAAVHEQQRNAKISGEGINSSQTNNYSGNLDKTDYSSILKNELNSGADTSAVQSTLNSRVNKANSATNLQPYANDALYQQALDYIANGKSDANTASQKAYSSMSDYDTKINDIYNKVMNNTYSNFQNSNEYAALQSQYTQQGQKAMKDTMGEASALTGGMASSYATTAGQQSYGNYMDKLSEAALDMYKNNQSNLLNELSTTENLRNDAYSEYSNEYSNAQTAKENKAKTMAAANDYSYYKSLGYSDADIAKMQATSSAESAAQYGDFSSYKALGYSDDAILKMQLSWMASNPTLAKSLYPDLYNQYFPSTTKSSSKGNSGTTSYEEANSNVSTWLNKGLSYDNIKDYLNSQYKSGAISKTEYNTYSLILDTNAYDAGQAARTAG